MLMLLVVHAEKYQELMNMSKSQQPINGNPKATYMNMHMFNYYLITKHMIV